MGDGERRSVVSYHVARRIFPNTPPKSLSLLEVTGFLETVYLFL
jgi:hypothetical protein